VRGRRLIVMLLAALATAAARAAELETLDVSRTWRLRALRFSGNAAVGTRELRQAMVTRARPWYTPWRRLPELDPVVLGADLERLRRLYEARITHDVEVASDDRVTVVISIEEREPVRVERVDVALEGALLPEPERRRLLAALPLAPGQIFAADAYDRTLAVLRGHYRERGFARVEVAKRAEVDLERHAAVVAYRVESGPPSVFGAVRVEGTEALDPRIVRRELAFEPDEPFAQSRLDRTRANLRALNLFNTIRIDEEAGGDGRVDLRLRLREAPPREIRLGVGYSTDEQVRGLASWRNYNFLGGARQLGFSARASVIERALTADFLQPHFPGASNRTRLLLSEQLEDEDTYDLNRARVSPRLEWQATARLTGFAFYRAEYDALSDVAPAVRARLPGAAPRHSSLSGVGVGADWDQTDDLADPGRGWVAGATVEPVGGVLGGDFAFLRLIAEGRLYQPLGGRLLGALRLRMGTADVLDGTGEVPLFERFYAGGINSVRGYGRRRVGPLVDDEPIGGRSLVETSIELRHPITESFGAAVFLDGGQVSLETFTFPFDDLRYGSGFGVSYRSPVGPLRVDLAFPVEPPPGDARWQVHVSFGAIF
jgi:outer membrane protein assembly complex protein YaeT